MNCPPTATCMKRWSRHGDGTVVISKSCYPKSRLDNLRMKLDECVQNTADSPVCTCSTDLCNSASNWNHWLTSILVTFGILFAIQIKMKEHIACGNTKTQSAFFLKIHLFKVIFFFSLSPFVYRSYNAYPCYVSLILCIFGTFVGNPKKLTR